MEPAGLGVRPGIERPHDLAAAVGVRATPLAWAGVTDVCARAVADEPTLAVELVRPELLAFRADPVIVGFVVREAGGPVAKRSPVGVGREQLEHERACDQEAHVARGQEHLRPHVTLAAAASSSPTASAPSGWRTSVKSRSGSSSVTCLTV